MFLIKRFLGENYERVNKIIDSYNNVSNNYINLEACCSYPFNSVMQAQSYPMFTLPTEGMVGNRYFPTFESMEEIDNYTEELVLNLLKIKKSEYSVCNQPHSGTQANQIVYNSILNDGDTILSLSPKSGGHISHNKFIKNINIVNFGLTSDIEINYSEIESLAKKHKPKLIIVGASSYPNIIDYNKIGEIAHKNNAYFMIDACHTILYIMAQTYTNPFPYVDFLTFSLEKVLRGPQGGIIVYKNKFKKKISYSVFPLTQGGPLQCIQFSKLLCFIELSNIDIIEYATKIQKFSEIMNRVFTKNNIETFSKDFKTHIILIDVSKYDMTGIEAEELFYRHHILVNKNLIPEDTLSPQITSGIRLGTTCLCNLGYEENDIILLAENISQLIKYKRLDIKNINYLTKKYHSKINISN